jgi:hypothetical protein
MAVKMFDNLALVDFYGERFTGEERYIIVTNDSSFTFLEDHLEDLGDILEKLYIYVINDGQIAEERAVSEEMFLF